MQSLGCAGEVEFFGYSQKTPEVTQFPRVRQFDAIFTDFLPTEPAFMRVSEILRKFLVMARFLNNYVYLRMSSAAIK